MFGPLENCIWTFLETTHFQEVILRNNSCVYFAPDQSKILSRIVLKFRTHFKLQYQGYCVNLIVHSHDYDSCLIIVQPYVKKIEKKAIKAHCNNLG